MIIEHQYCKNTFTSGHHFNSKPYTTDDHRHFCAHTWMYKFKLNRNMRKYDFPRQEMKMQLCYIAS